MERFSGLKEKAKDYAPFVVLRLKKDPYIEHVWLLKIKFEDGTIGLCIYNTYQKDFVEEPADLEMYDTTEEQIDKMYFPNLDY